MMRYYKDRLYLGVAIALLFALASLVSLAADKNKLTSKEFIDSDLRLIYSSSDKSGLHVIVSNSKISYTLTCNRKHSTCRTPVASKNYYLFRFNPRFYGQCENVVTLTTQPHEGEGIYCLDATSE